MEASLYDGDAEVARATALRLRMLDDDHLLEPAWSSPDVAPLPPPGDASQFRFPRMESGELGFWNAVEMSPVVGQLFVPGPAVVWFRLRVPVVAGEETLPLQRVAAVADFGNGVGSGIDRTRLTFINADLTVTLHRLPVGEWVGLDGVMFPERDRHRRGRDRPARRAGPHRSGSADRDPGGADGPYPAQCAFGAGPLGHGSLRHTIRATRWLTSGPAARHREVVAAE